MSTSEPLDALRRANPRDRAGFAQSVEETVEVVRARLAADEGTPSRRGRFRLVGAAVALAATSAAAALLLAGTPGGGPRVEEAAAAFERAATVTAASAERSGTAVVRITHDGELWAGTTVRWHGGDLAVSRSTPARRPGGGLLLVGGTMYGVDDDGRWVELGSPQSIDPGSGTTPDDYLAAVRADVGGATLRRITSAMTGLTTAMLDDGSTVYRGRVAAGLIARESGFKEGRAIRVLPFGFVAHDEAADQSAPLDAAVTVGADGVVRELAVRWPGWTYTVSYGNLGTAPPVASPENARPFKRPQRD